MEERKARLSAWEGSQRAVTNYCVGRKRRRTGEKGEVSFVLADASDDYTWKNGKTGESVRNNAARVGDMKGEV
jgi:hypothetical protein